MIDRPRVARKIAAVRDAVARIRDVLPSDVQAFTGDRTAREVVLLNLFVALQECIALATHWVADEGWGVPASYREAFELLADRGVIEPALAARLAPAVGLRNLVAHRYGALDWVRIHELASTRLGDLEEYVAALATAARAGP